MHIAEDTLDDLLRSVYVLLLKSQTRVSTSTKGANREVSGVLLEIKKPTARLSRTETKGTIFSCLGETIWYLAKTDKLDFIEFYIPEYKNYSDDGRTLYGAYGPRFFKMRQQINQFDSVIALLTKKPETRQAVIQVFNAEDILESHADIPCTCTLQFLLRSNRLHMITSMRSNDAYLGLPHDVFAFTFLQEIIARTLGVELGVYKHIAGSLHLYDRDQKSAQNFIDEKWQEKIEMPPMPAGTPWSNIEKLVSAEAEIRQGKDVDIPSLELPEYWADLARLLKIFAISKSGGDVRSIKGEMISRVFDVYIDKRIDRNR
jgi:thymidylate synthase